MDIVQEFRGNFNKDKIELCVNQLYEVYKKHRNNFKKAILNQNFFIPPITFKYTEEYHKKVISLFETIVKEQQDKNYTEEYIYQILQIGMMYEIIGNNFIHNTKLRKECGFFQNTFQDQLRMICIHFQDQKRLSEEKKKNLEGYYYTGAEMFVSSKNADINPLIKLSKYGNFESMLECFDNLIRYIFYRKKESIESEDNINKIDEIKHIYDPEYEAAFYIDNQNCVFKDLWDKFVYTNWILVNKKALNSEKEVWVLEPDDEKKARIHYIAGLRREILNTTNVNKCLIQYKKNMQDGLNAINKLANKIDIRDINSLFNINKYEYLIAKQYCCSTIYGLEKSTDEFYLSLKIDNINVEDILKGYEFLATISLILNYS